MGRLPPSVFVLVIALLSAAAGALLTWVLGYAITGRERRGAREPSQRDPTPAETGEVLRVSRTRQGLAVFVQGKPLRHLREITDPEVGREAVAAIKAVLAFAEGWLPRLQGGQKTLRAESGPSVVGDGRPSHHGPVSTEATSGTASESAFLGPLNLVEEIDALVQERLRARPDLSDLGVRLTCDIDGSILIYVGRQRYHSAAEIPHDDVRRLIRDAIRAWESQ
jgi:hypothetical protein